MALSNTYWDPWVFQLNTTTLFEVKVDRMYPRYWGTGWSQEAWPLHGRPFPVVAFHLTTLHHTGYLVELGTLCGTQVHSHRAGCIQGIQIFGAFGRLVL